MPLQGKSIREFRAELISCPVEYKDESKCEDVGKTTRVSDKNDVQIGNTNSHYRSYSAATGSTIRTPRALLQECVAGTQNTEVPGRARITGFLRATGLSFLTSLTVDIRQSESL